MIHENYGIDAFKLRYFNKEQKTFICFVRLSSVGSHTSSS